MSSAKSAIAAHRGGAALWPENSPTAFKNTLTLGVEQIEFDVQLSRDGVVVIHHDATLERTTTGSGPVAEKSLDELKTLEIRGSGGERLMTLEEGIAILAPSPIVLRCEIKPGPDLARHAGIEEKVFEILQRTGMLERTIITSFQIDSLAAVKAWPTPPAGLLWLVARPIVGLIGLDRAIGLAKTSGIPELGLHHGDLTAEASARIAAAGLDFGAWAVLEDEAIAKVLALGVKVFTTDRPDAALRLRAEAGEKAGLFI